MADWLTGFREWCRRFPVFPQFCSDSSMKVVRGCRKGGSALGIGTLGPFVTILRNLHQLRRWWNLRALPFDKRPGLGRRGSSRCRCCPCDHVLPALDVFAPASSITSCLYTEGMPRKSKLSKLLTEGKRAARIRRCAMTQAKEKAIVLEVERSQRSNPKAHHLRPCSSGWSEVWACTQ